MRAQDDISLRNFEILSYMQDNELMELKQHLYQRTYKKNQLLFTEGDPRERLYFLINGYVKLEKTNAEATMLYIDYVKANDLFPFGGFFKDEFYHYSALALTDITVLYIPTKILENKVKENASQLLVIIHRLSKILEQHECRLQTITTNNTRDRVEQAINYLVSRYGMKQGNDIVIGVPMTLTELAKLSGATRETVSHLCNELKEDGLISLGIRKIIVHDANYFMNKVKYQ